MEDFSNASDCSGVLYLLVSSSSEFQCGSLAPVVALFFLHSLRGTPSCGYGNEEQSWASPGGPRTPFTAHEAAAAAAGLQIERLPAERPPGGLWKFLPKYTAANSDSLSAANQSCSQKRRN